METLEVHAKDFLVKWVNAPENCTIVWQVKPLKKSINFGIYRKNDSSASLDAPTGESESELPSTPQSEVSNPTRLDSLTSVGRMRSQSVASVNKITELGAYKTKSRSSTFTSNLTNSDLTLVKNYYKLVPDELVKGTFDIKKGGMYAFIFDNLFSKTIAKKVYFSSKFVGGGDTSSLDRRSSKMSHPAPKKVATSQSLAEAGSRKFSNDEVMQSVLSKKRRKKLQGFTKRFFILNFQYGTLSYFKNNDNKLRGQMPIVDSIISANFKTREIFIDSGMEVWDLKALNNEDFDAWIKAFNTVKKNHTTDSAQKKAISPSPEQSASYALEDIHIQLNNLLSELPSLSKNELEFKILAINAQAASHISRPESSNDLTSVNSHTEFYDANDYIDPNDTGVVIMDGITTEKKQTSEDETDEEVEQSDDDGSSSDSDVESDELPAPSVSVREQGGEAKESQGDESIDLYPLPIESVERDCDIPVANHHPPSLLSFVRKNVGKDLTSLSMPVDMNEPVTILQKYAEIFEYADLIDNALQGNYPEDSCELILRIAAFAVTYLSGARHKVRSTRKPFNPLLGETFELVREDMGFRLISEKVSHKPPVFAMFVESKDWCLSFSPAPSQKFWGKTSEIYTSGTLKLTIRSTGETFTWSHPTLVLKNIIAGEKYTEPTETMTIKSSSGQKAVVEFSKGGMFSGRSEEVTIKAYDSSKKQSPYTVSGKWTESMTLKTNTTEKLIWEAGSLLPKCEKKFGFTEFAGSLNKITSIEKDHLPPSDSRLRPDMQTYEKGDVAGAEKLKQELEEGQRQRRKEFEANNETPKPLFFEHVGGDLLKPDSGEWVYKSGEGSYWQKRKDNDWSDVPKLW